MPKEVTAMMDIQAHLDKVVARVETQGGKGVYGGGQLAVLEGRKPLLHVAS